MFRGFSITPRNFYACVHRCFVFNEVKRSGERLTVGAIASPRRWMTSRRPLVLELGGNTILFRLLTKPVFCSFPLLDDRKASNGGICTEREEVLGEHEELNKIKILFNLKERENLYCLSRAVLERFSPEQAVASNVRLKTLKLCSE